MASARLVALLACLVVLMGCGVPQTVPKQAEQVGSIAAEGSLLARDIRQGDSTSRFARVHSAALREKLAPLADAVEHDELAAVVRSVDEQLAAVEEHPGDATRAARIEQRLEDAARRAAEIQEAVT